MASDSINRETVRDEIVALIQAAMIDSNQCIQEVLGYQKATFEGHSPVVVVSSAGSARVPAYIGSAKVLSSFFMDLYVFVKYKDKDSAWTEAKSEDKLDLVEKRLTDVVSDNKSSAGKWHFMQIIDQSLIDNVPIAGAFYKREVIRVKVDDYMS